MQHDAGIDAVDRFVEAAELFCRLVEQHGDLSPGQFLQRVHAALPSLYVLALSLPRTDALFDGPPPSIDGSAEAEEQEKQLVGGEDPDRGTHDEWKRLFGSLSAYLGVHNAYREVYDPYDPPDEVEVVASLADDLADLWRDLRAGARKWRRGEVRHALWALRFDFEAHWCHHATGALRALCAQAAWHDVAWPSVGASAA